MTSTIRTGRLSDVEAVLSLWAAAGAEPSHTDDAKSVAKLIVHDPLALMVAEDNDQLVGSVIAGGDGWRGSIYRLAVAPSHRRLGLGTRLLHAAEARLSTTGGVRLQGNRRGHGADGIGILASEWMGAAGKPSPICEGLTCPSTPYIRSVGQSATRLEFDQSRVTGPTGPRHR
jgi:GNAT superfamily N-acetyltransferase